MPIVHYIDTYLFIILAMTCSFLQDLAFCNAYSMCADSYVMEDNRIGMQQ